MIELIVVAVVFILLVVLYLWLGARQQRRRLADFNSPSELPPSRHEREMDFQARNEEINGRPR